MNLLEKLDDLIVQATHERSHYYVKSVVVEAKNEIERQHVLLGIAKDGFRVSEKEIERLRLLLTASTRRIPHVLDQIDREFGAWPDGSNECGREKSVYEATPGGGE